MSHSYIKIYIHVIWVVKRRRCALDKNIRSALYRFLMKKSKESEIPFLKLNIQPEHIHGLIYLPSHQKLSDFMHIIKGSSSYFLNKHFFETKFQWQTGYAAFSVGYRNLKTVCDYIENQDKHHSPRDSSWGIEG